MGVGHLTSSSTLLYYRLDEGAASDAADDVMGHLDLPVVGAPAVAAGRVTVPLKGGSTLTRGARSIGGAAVGFRQTAIGADAANLRGDLSVGAWVKPASIGALQYILACGGPTELEADNFLVLLHMDAAGLVKMLWEYGAGTDKNIAGTGTYPPLGAWSHVVVVRSGLTVKFYLNGALVHTATFTAAEAPTGGDGANVVWMLGSNNGATPFSGALDDVWVDTRATSAEEVLAEYERSAYLRMAGINLDQYLVPGESGRLTPEWLGERRRAFDGGARRDDIGFKERWKLKTVPLAQSTTTALRALFEGRGDSVDCNDLAFFTGCGARGTSSGGEPDTPAGKYGTAYKCNTAMGYDDVSFSLTWLVGTTGAWTMFYWWSDDGTTWHHRIHTSAGSKWQDGATSVLDFGDVAMASGVFTFSAAVTDPVWIDDVVIWPFVIPSDWVMDIFSEHAARAWVAPPSLRASGQLVPDAPRTVRGNDNGSTGFPHVRTTLQKGGEVLEAELFDA